MGEGRKAGGAASARARQTAARLAREARARAVEAALDHAGAPRQPDALPAGIEAWHLLLTSPGQERGLVCDLRRAGFGVYRPTERVLMPRGARRAASAGGRAVIVVEQALFPGYLFVGRAGVESRATAMDFGLAESLPGARGWLRVDSRPVHLERALVAALWRDEAAGAFDRVSALRSRRRATRLKPGQAVDIVDGPLAPGRAVVHIHAARERVKVVVTMMGVERVVDVPLDHLAVA
jgi:transcription antitermination factor NusG